jgi:hypothetical protein
MSAQQQAAIESPSRWPQDLPARQVRIARQTDRLDEVVAFYEEGLGLPRLGGFEGHAGYSGVMIGFPDAGVHLEFTHHDHGSPGEAPSEDNLLVLYIPDRPAIESCVERLGAMGHRPVPPANPYWQGRSVTIPDPDGWRLVLVWAAGFDSDGVPNDGPLERDHSR